MKPLLYLLVGVSLLSEILIGNSAIFGVILYFILITGILISFSYSKSFKEAQKIMIIFMVIILARILGLFLDFGFFYSNLVIYLALFSAAIYYSYMFKVNLGFRKNLIFLPVVVILAVIIGLVGNALIDIEKYANLIFIIPIIAYSEEILFRGLLQKFIKKSDGRISSILFTSLLYAIFSMSLGLYAALFFFVASLILSSVYELSDNIILTIAMNLTIGILFFA